MTIEINGELYPIEAAAIIVRVFLDDGMPAETIRAIGEYIAMTGGARSATRKDVGENETDRRGCTR